MKYMKKSEYVSALQVTKKMLNKNNDKGRREVAKFLRIPIKNVNFYDRYSHKAYCIGVVDGYIFVWEGDYIVKKAGEPIFDVWSKKFFEKWYVKAK